MVKAILGRQQVTIDNATGEATVARKGELKGFGQGFRDYVMKGGKAVEPEVTVVTGQLPAHHEHAGSWCVQINILPLDNEEDAATLADRVGANIRDFLRIGTLKAQ